MSKFQFVRLCAVALLIFTLVECAFELVDLPNKLEAMTSFDLQQMTYSLLGISSDAELGSSATVLADVPTSSFLQKSIDVLLTLFLLSCQLLGAIGILIANRESLGRFGRFSIRVWIFFSALALLSSIVPIVSSAVNVVDRTVEQKVTEGLDSANESLLKEYPMVAEGLELLQSSDLPQGYFARLYGLLIVGTLLIYTVLTFMAIKMWRDAKKFRYS